MFQQMNDAIREETVRHLLNFETPTQRAAREAAEAAKNAAIAGLNQLEGSVFVGQKAPMKPTKDSNGRTLGLKRPESGKQKLTYSSSATQGAPVRGAQPPVGSAFGAGQPRPAEQQANQQQSDPYAGMNRQQRRAAERRAAKQGRKR